MAWYEVLAWAYTAFGVVKLGVVTPALKFSVAYSLYRQPKDRSPLAFIITYVFVSVAVAVLFWPYLLLTEKFKFFVPYTEGEVRESIDAAYEVYELNDSE